MMPHNGCGSFLGLCRCLPRAVWGKCYIKNVFDLSSQKLSLQKIFGSNLSLKNRILVSTPTPPYASLREARLNFSEKDLVTPIAQLYRFLQTYFSRKQG